MKRKWKRTLSILLSFAMVLSMTGMNTVFATEGDQTIGASGLCEHHTEHSKDVCGYTEGTPEIPCSHEHTDECYKEVTKCVHEHSDDCYPAEDGVSDNDATPSDATPKEPTECTHMCSAESGCITTEPDCSHEHEDDCGYAPAVPGTPCAFVCEECAKDSGQPSPEPTPCTRTEGCTLEDGHEGGCDGAVLASPLAAPLADEISIVSVSPGNEATDVPVDTDIVVTFSDTIRDTDNINVRLLYSDGNNSTSHGGSASASREGAVYTMHYANDLLPDTTYSVHVIIEVGENILNNFENMPTFTTAAAAAVTTVTTAAELKTALEAATPAAISVTANIELSDAITLGADHTLNIADGVTVSTGNNTLTIPDGKTLTLSGTGTLTANAANIGIQVNGTLKLTDGSNLVADSIIVLGASSTPGSLESNGGHITIQNSGTISYGIYGGSDTGDDRVALAGGSLTVRNTAYDGITGVKLDISDHCTVTVASTDASVSGLKVDEMSVAGSMVRIENTVGQGLLAKRLTVENSAVTVTNSAGTGILITDYQQDAVFNLKNSTLALENTGGTGLLINASDSLLIDGSTVTIAANGGTGLGRENTTAQVLGANSGKLTLIKEAKLYIAQGIFRDRGSVFNGTGPVTVGAENSPASVEAITAGDYVWDGQHFTKGAASTAVTGELRLGGSTVVSDLTTNGSGTTTGGVGWAWNASTATLTLTGDGSIGDDGTIKFFATGDITVEVNDTVRASTLQHSNADAGKLTLTGGGTLTLTVGSNTIALWAGAGLTISGPTVSASTTGSGSDAVRVNQGSFTMTGGKLTAIAAGAGANGITAEENIAISGTVEVTASGYRGLFAIGDINISGGTVDAAGTGSSNPRAIVASGALNISGGSVTAGSASNTAITATGGVTVGDATLAVGETGESKGVWGNLTVNHANANVAVNGYVSTTSYGGDDGNLTVSAGTVKVTGDVAGDLTVSGGAVTVGGSVIGLTNHTGGTLNGKQPPTQITFAAEQTGGVSGTADSTGIRLTFSQDVTGLTKSAIKIDPGTGWAGSSGEPTGSGTVWTVPIFVVREGTVAITIDQFGDFGVSNNPQTVTVYQGGGSAPTVTDVVVSPLQANVQKGTTQQFTAFVIGENDPAQTVIWRVTGGGAGTSISDTGLLTVAADETAATLTVQATSTVNTSKTGSALVTVTDTPVTTYALIVMDGSGGGSYEAGATVTIMADPLLPGEVFDKWVLTSGGGTLADANSATTTYTMPGNAATVTATYKAAPIGSHTITASAGTGGSISPSGTITVNSGESKTFTISANSNYSISSVTVDGVNQGAISSYTFSNVTDNHTISATFRYNGGGSSGGGGGGGGGSSSGGSTPTVTPPDPGKPDTATNAETKVTPTVNANGSATVTVPEKSVTDAIKAAQDAAKKAGTEKNGVSVTIDATTTGGASDITATLTANSVDALIKAGVTKVRIKSDAATITLDLPALKAAQATAGGAVTVSAKPVAANTLSAAAQNAIGNRPVFSFTLQSGGKPVTSFGGGSAAIAIPYAPPKGEDTGKLCVVYVDDNGGVTYLTDSSYDPNTKALIARTGHFSVYGVGYKADAPVFTDTANHWAKADIDFVAARGLLSGTGNNQFSPNTGMTRGMFVTALHRLAGNPQAAGEGSAFTDVPASAYYADAVKWAAEKGVVSGTTSTTFAPDRAVTRQEMAVIMANYAKAMGYTVPKTREAVTFADNGSIGSWAKDAVKAMQMAGILNGKDGNRFDPQGTATRAEVAAVLHRYVELVIDPATAQGWTQNDAGQWLYYENGKPVTGWKQVDGKWYFLDTAGIMQSGGWKQIGGKWYYLYADGSMAVNTKIDGYEIGPDGAWKES
ncbi:S-layer homology domain-containing protein [Enterocloster lavalensis]|uniref:S-layer homology domain-containing protein n=1 Tax=Enterocloster lavalensis TaxID=460384 RepID=UPI001D08EA25|nr:S-layer homology domain-containing protein [Enterocloster lavalensis]MCB6344067.1 S-layer homology domain-containing protein [Enterocloster lavalensis]